ncbi:MAG: peptide chain release factor N(5)-glutamine methyltransferase [Gemmatimonadetes bacterium]|nr:peptide chain release factor N(5)-glutamine methyltransferase [Gemmatimonadota bacterium]
MSDEVAVAGLVTVGEALERARSVLQAAGVPDARRETEEIYAAVVCGATSAAWLDRQRELPVAVRDRFEQAVSRRGAGWPQAYAVGRVNFRGHWLSVDPRVLIPRPETEGLVELVMRLAVRRSGGQADGDADRLTAGPPDRLPVVADVGTGSGAIAIALALEASVSGVIAIDSSNEALNLAIENATLLGAKERISFRRGHLLEPLLGEPVDAIVSNPPYVATDEWEALEPPVRDYEPRLALDGGPDGMGTVRELIGQAKVALLPGGLLALEVDARRASATAEVARKAGFERVEVAMDLFGRPRYVHGRQSGAL